MASDGKTGGVAAGRTPGGAFRRLVVPALFTLVGIAILVSLGVWQLERLAWKEALIARVAERLDATPVPAPGPDRWAKADLADLEYQPLTVGGHYRNDAEVHVVYALTAPHGPAGGSGYMVMTPFVTDAGWQVYVNRGFVPAARKDPATRSEGLIEGPTTVTGLFRGPAARSWFMPADDAAKNVWFSRDPALYAWANGLPVAEVAPYVIDAARLPDLPGGLPQGGETIVAFPNDHLGYALTWFGFAAALAGVFAFYVRAQLRGG